MRVYISDVKECSFPNNVCQNGGTCEEIAGDYHCNCALGYAGKNCDKGITEYCNFLGYQR